MLTPVYNNSSGLSDLSLGHRSPRRGGSILPQYAVNCLHCPKKRIPLANWYHRPADTDGSQT